MYHPAKMFFSKGHPLFSIFEVDFVETLPELLVLKFTALEVFSDRENPGHLHSGFSTLILDSVMGGAVMGSLDKLQPIATVNLTTQHTSRPAVDDVVLCSGRVESIENEIAIVTGQVTCAKTKAILASAIGSFMVGTRATPLMKTKMESNK